MLFVSVASAAPGDPVDPTDSDGDGAPDEVEANSGFNPSFKDNDLFGNARLFVMQQYRDFLARESDSDGTDFWVSAMLPKAGQQPVPRTTMVQTFIESAEFGGVVAPVARLYFAYFLRIPDYGGLNFWILRHRGGESLTTISDQFAQSAEFAAQYGPIDDSEFVKRVYQNVLGRPPDPGGLEHWVGQLAAGMTRGQMMVQFSESPEYRNLIANEVYVTMLYSGMLRRAPDPGGFSYWVGSLDNGVSIQGLIDLFVGSQEYRNRFLQAGSTLGVPEVRPTWPLDGGQNIPVLVPVTATFSEPMSAGTINGGTFTLTGPAGPVPATVSYTSDTATLLPSARLVTDTTYSARISRNVLELAGTGLAKD